MTNKNNALCSICGKGYYKCVSCKDMINLNPWKRHTDTAEHYKVYQIIHGFSTGVYTQEEARLKLTMVDLSDIDSFRDHIRNIIQNIMKEECNSTDNVVTTDEPITIESENNTDKLVDNDILDVIEENVKLSEYKNTRRRKFIESESIEIK